MPYTLFDHHRDEIWRQLSDEIGGEFLEKNGWAQEEVVVRSGDWTVTIDLTTLPAMKEERLHTRIYAPLSHPDGFRFSVDPETAVDRLANVLGMPDVQVGDEVIDNRFHFSSNQEDRLRRLFSNANVRELLRDEKEVHLALDAPRGILADTFPAGTDVLSLLTEGRADNLDRLKRLYLLFTQILKLVTFETAIGEGSEFEENP